MTPERIRLHIIAEPGSDVASLRSALECSLGESLKDQEEEDMTEAHEQMIRRTTKERLLQNNSSHRRRLREDSKKNETSLEEPSEEATKLWWWEIVLFESKKHMHNVTIVAPNNEQKGNLAADLNYARFYLPDLLPDVEKIIYMDADTIASKDVCKLFDTALVDKAENQSSSYSEKPVIAAVARDFKSVCFSLLYCDEPRVRDFLRAEGVMDPERDLNFFNAGVIVFHLKRWAERKLTERAEFWMRANAELPIYSLGSNPPLLLAVGKHFEALDPKWNCDGFGFKKPTAVSLECQVDAGIRHWSGHLKPWRRDGKYKMFWYPYVSDLNCLLLLSHAPLTYAPPREVPPRQRAISPGPNSIPTVDLFPPDLLLKLGDNPNGHTIMASQTTTTTTTTTTMAKTTNSEDDENNNSSPSADKAAPPQKKNDDKDKNSGMSSPLQATTMTTLSGAQPGWTQTQEKKRAANRDSILSGDTALHRSREAFGLQAVMDEMQRSLNAYPKKSPEASRFFVEKLRSHPSVVWKKAGKNPQEKRNCATADHILVIVHNNSLYVDSHQYGPRSPCGARPPEAAMAVFKFLHSFIGGGAVTLPDTLFLLCVDPRGTSYSDVPIFGYGKARGHSQPGVLVPNPHFGRSHVKRWEHIAHQFEEAAQRHSWDDRLSSVFWRGPFASTTPKGEDTIFEDLKSSFVRTAAKKTTTKNVRLCEDEANVARLEAVSLTYRLPELFDMKVADENNDAPLVFTKTCRPPIESSPVRTFLEANYCDATKKNAHDHAFLYDDPHVRHLFSAKWTGRISSMAYKYVAALPDAGDAPPPGRNELWLFGAVVLLWRTPAVEWYSPALVDGITHLTIDKHNAIDKVRE